LGKVERGVKCSVDGCGADAERSLRSQAQVLRLLERVGGCISATNTIRLGRRLLRRRES